MFLSCTKCQNRCSGKVNAKTYGGREQQSVVRSRGDKNKQLVCLAPPTRPLHKQQHSPCTRYSGARQMIRQRDAKIFLPTNGISSHIWQRITINHAPQKWPPASHHHVPSSLSSPAAQLDEEEGKRETYYSRNASIGQRRLCPGVRPAIAGSRGSDGGAMAGGRRRTGSRSRPPRADREITRQIRTPHI